MQITFKPNELAFVFDKNTKVKSIIPHGECEFTVLFEQCNEKSTSPEHETSPETQAVDSVKILETTNNNVKCEQMYEVEFPTIEEVMEFIKSKENYTYDNKQIQEHFFRRILTSRDDTQLYRKLADLINRAKYRIGEEEKGKWKDAGFRKISNNQRTKVYTFVTQKPRIDENEILVNNED